jgi:hypothetical protein
MIGGAILDINDREFGEFQAFLWSVVAAMIEEIQAVRPFPTFGDDRTIDDPNLGSLDREQGRDRDMIIGREIKDRVKVPGIRFFVQVTVPTQIAKGHLPP